MLPKFLRNGSSVRRPLFRPMMELLEDRAVPAFYQVQTLGDGASNVSSGDGSEGNPFRIDTLRGAITTTNGSAADDVITFASGLAGGTIALTNGTLPAITDELQINGIASNLITVQGDPNVNFARVFENVSAGSSISDLRVTFPTSASSVK